MTQEQAIAIFEAAGGIKRSHFQLTSGMHSAEYLTKDVVGANPQTLKLLALPIAEHFQNYDVSVVLSPTVGAIKLGHEVAAALTHLTDNLVYACIADKGPLAGFIIARGHDEIVSGVNVLVGEDVITTGGSTREVVLAAQAVNGKVVGAAGLWYRGNQSVEKLNFPYLFVLVTKNIQSWTEPDCPLCKQGIPRDKKFGKG